ncbi:hypothetical protein GOP47_0030602 [Adiantum capillus-veneris]|nr:hypothetical protein GOP47_0030602 [Adiantum capillus-veneris]
MYVRSDMAARQSRPLGFNPNEVALEEDSDEEGDEQPVFGSGNFGDSDGDGRMEVSYCGQLLNGLERPLQSFWRDHLQSFWHSMKTTIFFFLLWFSWMSILSLELSIGKDKKGSHQELPKILDKGGRIEECAGRRGMQEKQEDYK